MVGYLTMKQLAARWGVSRQRIQRLCALGRLPFVQAGSQYLFRMSDVDQYRPRRREVK